MGLEDVLAVLGTRSEVFDGDFVEVDLVVFFAGLWRMKQLFNSLRIVFITQITGEKVIVLTQIIAHLVFV